MAMLKFIWEEPMARDQRYGGVGKPLKKVRLSGFQVSSPEKEIIVGKVN